MPLVLFDLPDVLLYLVLRHLDPVSMKMCCQTCRLLREIGMNEHEWKRACLRDFWWCFWDGKCCGDANNNNLYFQSVIKRNSAALSHDIFQNAFVVDSLSPRVLAKLTQQKQQHSSNSPTSSLYSPMVTSPFSSSSPLSPSSSTRRFDDDACPFPHRKTFNPYHPLHTNWYEAYWTIYYGKYTSYLQVLNSLENRELSAFFALGTFDHRLSRLVVSYSDSLIARYRQGENIVLKARDIDTDDNMELLCIGNDRHRIRRILEDMLEWAPPEIYARELFDMIDPRTRMHTYLPGAQVEVSPSADKYTF